MCFESDAQNWTNLKDVKTIKIANGKYEEVTITGNWFATSIVASVFVNNKMYVTYANHLSYDTKYIYSLILHTSVL